MSLKNNLHHLVSYRSKEDFLDSLLGRGPGDPDVVGHYPGQRPARYTKKRSKPTELPF